MLNSAGKDSFQSPERRTPGNATPAEADVPPGGSGVQRMEGILAQILTLAETGNPAGTDDQCREELLAVARKLVTHDFCREPVLLELVQVLTGKLQGISEVRRAALDKSVTATLYEDQASLSRLQQLWTHLRGLVTHAQ